MRSEDVKEIFYWITTVFAKKFGEACKEKNEEKQRLLKAALGGALRGLEHEALLSKLREVRLHSKAEDNEAEAVQESKKDVLD